MEDGLLSLKWNNHKSTFFHILGQLRGKQTYTDATLACEGKFYPVHKLVMSTCSDYFSDIFERTPCKNPVIVLKDIKKSDLEALLDYMYIGEVDVRQSELAGLIKAAECLRIKGLAVPDEDPTKTSPRKGSNNVSERREDSPPAKRKRRESGGGERSRASPVPQPRMSSSSHSSSLPSQATQSTVPESRVPLQQMPPPPSHQDSTRNLDSQRVRHPLDQSHHSSHQQSPSVRSEPSSLRSPNSENVSGHSSTSPLQPPDSNILPVQMIKVEVEDGLDQRGPISHKDENQIIDRDTVSDVDNESGEDVSNDYEYQAHESDVQKEEEPDHMDSYGSDQLPGPSGLQGGPVLNWGDEGEGGFPHNLFGSDDQAAQQAVVAQHSLSRMFAGVGGPFEDVREPLDERQVKVYQCNLCSYSSQRRWLLKRHMRVHTGEKPYQCLHCHYAAANSHHLKIHIRTHTGEKPYQCPHCSYRGSQSGDLKSHLRKHTEEGPYKCSNCSFVAPASCSLRIHMREHAGDKAYSCPHCPYVANQTTHIERIKILDSHIHAHFT